MSLSSDVNLPYVPCGTTLTPGDDELGDAEFENGPGQMDERTRQQMQKAIEGLSERILIANDRLAAGAPKDEVMRDVLQPMMPANQQIILKADFERTRRAFDKVFRAAARPYRASGWEVRTRSLRFHGPEGHWGEIWFRSETHQRPLPVDIYAGVTSPYLMRTLWGRNPERPVPALHFDISLVWWQRAITFSEDSLDSPEPFDFSRALPSSPGVELSPATASGWIAQALETIVPEIEGLCSDLAMRDWYLEHRATDAPSLREAALLTRHLGLTDELPAVLELAERAYSDRSVEWPGGALFDRKRTYDIMWSHKRFMRFFNEVGP